MLSINHTSTPVVRLALLWREAKKQKKILYITDSWEDIFMMRTFARSITGNIWEEVSWLGELWSMLECEEGYFFMSSDILRYTGNLVHLQRTSGMDIARWSTLTEQACIERLIEMGYTHGDATDTPATYNKSWGTLTIRDALLPRRIACEWFDTELDSIILYDGDIRTHNAYIRINTVPDNIHLEKWEKLNPVLAELLRRWSDFKADNNNILGFGGGNLSKNSSTKNNIREEFSSDEWGQNTEEQSEEGASFSSPDSFGTFATKSTDNGTWEKTIEPYNSQTIIVSGCDFIENKDILLHTADIHMWWLADRWGTSVDGSIPDIPSLLEFAELLKSEKNITIYTRYPRTVEDFFEYNSIVWIPMHEVASARLTSGTWIADSERHYIIADDILGQIFVKKRTKKSIAKHLDLLLSLNPGDYVVHREHGIALFHAVVKKTLGAPMTRGDTGGLVSENNGITREYIELHYAEWDKLFIPLTEIYRISRYIGENSPELTRLSGTEWERTMDKTNEEIEAIAMDILETSAKRTLAKGRAFSSFPSEEKKFQEAFAYEYTLDQKTAIDEIFADMESANPMDRLVSGDVGFGKTEVAMNAIYKAVLSGTQVAVLSPLLVLADEHYETFCERLSPFGVRVGVLTRMSNPSEVKNTLNAMKSGTIDVVVGTHRLISDDIVWKRLGLLIIDEEHKFWVTHKEKIKKIKSGLDILSLSATPIPRSLNLALSGLKKISLLTTPPRLKKPIETIVTKWNESVIRDAIIRELERGGQTIIIHNRIRGMESIASELEMILDERKIKTESEGQKNGWKIADNREMVSNTPLIRGDTGGLISNKKHTHLPYNPELTTKAQENRKKMNAPEKKFWFDILKQEPLSSYKFTKQKPILEYIVDFYCSELWIVIEIDGESHIENTEYDKYRTTELSELWLTVIRYTNQDVMMHTEWVYENLVSIIKAKTKQIPLPPLSGGLENQYHETNTLYPQPRTSYQEPRTKNKAPRIIITHGQMPAEQIEDRIHAFKKREYNILLTTTIIENGVNFLSANTIIIIDPEEFGLASLHQLRGRVGRKDIAWTCYLIYRKPELAWDEKERLITIANNTHLGAGFEIAMRDMEIRGAWDVLGIKQAGKSKDIGLTLYFRMLEEKISELKEEKKTRTWTKIELELSYVIPDEYFSSDADKLSFYREIENIETLAELEEVEEELRMKSKEWEIQHARHIDEGDILSHVSGQDISTPLSLRSIWQRSWHPVHSTKNPVPCTISNLFLLLRARILMSEYRVEKLSKVGMNYVFDFCEGIDVREVRNFLERFDTRKIYTLVSMSKIRVETRHYQSIANFLESLR